MLLAFFVNTNAKDYCTIKTIEKKRTQTQNRNPTRFEISFVDG